MRQFLIERHIPGIEGMSDEELQSIVRRSNTVLADLGDDIQWLHSYVVNGMTYCLYNATDEELLREHSRMTGIPCNNITQVQNIINPETG